MAQITPEFSQARSFGPSQSRQVNQNRQNKVKQAERQRGLKRATLKTSSLDTSMFLFSQLHMCKSLVVKEYKKELNEQINPISAVSLSDKP